MRNITITVKVYKNARVRSTLSAIRPVYTNR